MANAKITDLTSAGTLDGTELCEVVQGGASKKALLSGYPISTAVAAALGGKAASSHGHAISDVTGLATALAAKADLVAGKVPTSQLPDAILGALSYQGTWNATTNSPAISAASSGNKGHYYVVATAGTTSIDGEADWAVGDWIVSSGVVWSKVDNSDKVSSVAGRTGSVVLVKGDVGLGNVDNTSDAGKPVSTAQAAAIAQKRSLGRWVEFDTPEYVKYVSSTSIKINGSGRAVVDGTLLEWASDITWSGSSGSAPLAAAGMVYAYLYDSGSGIAALEVSTTAPEFNATQKYWRKTGDSSRRCVWAGYVWATTTPTYRFVPFIATWQNGSAEVIYESEYIDASNRFSLGGSLNCVSAGTATTPTSFTLTHVPAHASHWYASSKMTFVSANDDAIGIINHSSWTTTGAAADAPLFSVRNTAVVAGSRTYFGRAWLPVRTARTAYYCLQHVVGTTSNIYIEDPGFRIPV